MEISLTEVWEALGGEPPRGRKAKCILPDHPDRNPSVSFDEDKGLWMCFVCDKGGDAIALVMALEGLPFREAKERVHNLIGREVEDDARPGPGYLGGRKRKKRPYKPKWL